MINKIFNLNRGFTILESIVAIAILSLSISGVFSAVQQSLSQSIIAKDEVKAFYLAQEAVEMIRNKRDSNQLSNINGIPTNWLAGITDAGNCPFNEICQVDAVANSLVYCGTDWDDCPVLRQDLTIDDVKDYLYGYDLSWTATNFKREIRLERVQNDSFGNPIEIAVIVRISWKKGLINRDFTVKTHLFNWR